ncbi:MAG: hypothetical protein KAI24_06150, partial [Planctomycetes bacterium]|nr:hypothetical protein [Planctomycetota bacterium]
SEQALSARLDGLLARLERLRASRLGRLTYDREALPMMGALCAALARCGRIDDALVELEPLLCGFAPDGYGRTPTRNVRQVETIVDELLQLEVSDRRAWLEAIGRRAVAWHAEGRLAEPAKTLAAFGAALAEAGLSDLARPCADGLRALAADDAFAEQRLAGLWRALGDETRAYTLDKQLLTRRRLAIADLPRVLRQIRDHEGPAVAFAAGERALSYTADVGFLEVMAELAVDLGQDDRAWAWRAEIERRAAKPAEPAAPATTAPERPGRG